MSEIGYSSSQDDSELATTSAQSTMNATLQGQPTTEVRPRKRKITRIDLPEVLYTPGQKVSRELRGIVEQEAVFKLKEPGRRLSDEEIFLNINLAASPLRNLTNSSGIRPHPQPPRKKARIVHPASRVPRKYTMTPGTPAVADSQGLPPVPPVETPAGRPVPSVPIMSGQKLSRRLRERFDLECLVEGLAIQVDPHPTAESYSGPPNPFQYIESDVMEEFEGGISTGPPQLQNAYLVDPPDNSQHDFSWMVDESIIMRRTKGYEERATANEAEVQRLIIEYRKCEKTRKWTEDCLVSLEMFRIWHPTE